MGLLNFNSGKVSICCILAILAFILIAIVGSSKKRRLIFYVCLLGLTLRIVHLVASGDNPLLCMPVLDERYYVGLGKAIAEGRWLGEDGLFFMDPLYEYLKITLVKGDSLHGIQE
jgi:hypothetical protein